ncbi:MAG: hypothetical protein H8E94_00225 [Alphaproteobacteria bacterium]|nr:hypothetical protein [Alphaproteobacteria bacterium]
MRMLIAAVMAVFLMGCVPKEPPVVTAPAVECRQASAAALRVQQTISGQVFKLDEETRLRFLSNLNATPPVTSYNWPIIYVVLSPRHMNAVFIAADTNGCLIGANEIPLAAFHELIKPPLAIDSSV